MAISMLAIAENSWLERHVLDSLLYTSTGCLITSTLTLQFAEEQQLVAIRFVWNTNSFIG